MKQNRTTEIHEEQDLGDWFIGGGESLMIHSLMYDDVVYCPILELESFAAQKVLQ